MQPSSIPSGQRLRIRHNLRLSPRVDRRCNQLHFLPHNLQDSQLELRQCNQVAYRAVNRLRIRHNLRLSKFFLYFVSVPQCITLLIVSTISYLFACFFRVLLCSL
jgi:hypothetical protein